MNKPSQEQIDKLPKWAQNHIRSLEMERDEANKLLTEFTDSQTKSSFYYQELRGSDPSTGTRYPARYIQTHRVCVRHEGLDLEVLLPCGAQGRTGVEIRFSAAPGFEAALFPSSSNCVSIKACKEAEGLK